jgi:hypothetical protein
MTIRSTFTVAIVTAVLGAVTLSGAEASVVVRDHRTNQPTVRDHRTSQPIVRDHREGARRVCQTVRCR